MSYGFRRNSFGVKGLGITVSAASLVAVVALLYTKESPLAGVDLILGTVGALIDFALLWFWLVVVSSEWVQQAADLYAKALFSASDAIVGGS